MKTVEVPFNLNDYVKVQLTPKGHKILKDAHRALFKEDSKYPYKPPEEDADGWSKWQLWCFMGAIGKHIHMGMQPPVNPNIKFICNEVSNDTQTPTAD